MKQLLKDFAIATVLVVTAFVLLALLFGGTLYLLGGFKP